MQTFGTTNPSLAPRNVRQVYNIASKIKRTEGTRDDLFEMFCLARENPEYVTNFKISKSLNIAVSHPSLRAHIQNVMNIQAKEKHHIVFHYDTTFGVGDFYVSLLSKRHPFLETEPIILVGTLMHEFADEIAHNEFFESMTEEIPLLNSEWAVIVTDREKSNQNAIKKKLPEAHLVFCWNHMRKVRTV